MARVKWIKLFTDLFEDEKIIMLSTRQNGESLILTWLKLLCLAGKINDGGAITIGEQKPYTAEMISSIFHKPLDETNSALDIFEEYDMISRKNGIVKILSWDRYQNVKSLKKIKEANANKQEEKRKEERRDIEIREERIREGEGEEEGEKEKVSQKEKSAISTLPPQKATATESEVKTLFPSLIIDTTPAHTYSDYSSALYEYNRSEFARTSFKTLSLLDKHLLKITQGCYQDYKKSVMDSSKMFIPQTYTKEEIDSVFRDVKDIDIDNWDV